MKKASDIIMETDIKTLPGGVRVKFNQISLSILDAINHKFPDPEPPLVEIEGKSTPDKPYYESNPNDPDYAIQLRNVAQERGTAMIDAMIIMGVELVDGVPDNEGWLKTLQFNQKVTGVPDLSGYDLEDEMEKEFVFKKFYAIGRDGMKELAKYTGVTEEGIDDAMSSFPGDEERIPDPDSSS